MKFFLTGFMGAGKSTIGKYASRQNDLEFLDLDSYIEAQEGRAISEIFRQDGEAHFRQLERDALQAVIGLPGKHLVSTGGGTPCYFDNMARMNAAGHTIYLDLSAARLTDRLRNAKDKRPLVASLKGDLQVFVHVKLLERAEFYAQAQHIVPEEKANKKDVAELLGEIISGAPA